MNALARIVQEAAHLWVQALRLHADPGATPHWLPYLVILAAAVAAWLVGQSSVLAINRMHWRGMLFTLLVGVLVLGVVAAVSGTLLWVGAAVLLHAGTPGILPLARVVVLSTAPLVFSFVTVIPLLGPMLERLLQLWMLAILAASCLSLWRGAQAWQTVLVLAAVAAVHFGLLALIGPRVGRVRDRLYRRLTGRPLHASASYLLELTTA